MIAFTTVIGVHVLAGVFATSGTGGAAAMSLMVVTRKAFFFLLALVAVQAQLARPDGVLSFWRRRIPVVAVPYALWSLVYAWPVLKTSPSLAAALEHCAFLLVSGKAMYHLYFLLVSMQVYLLLPVLLAAVRRLGRWQLPLLAVSLALQVGQHAFIEYGTATTGLAGWYRAHCGELAVTYQFWVLLGLVAGLHLARLQRLVDAARGWPLLVMLGVGVLSILHVQSAMIGGENPWKASSTFSPYLVPWYVAAIVGTYAAGSLYARWSARTGRRLRVVGAGAQASFGVYLAHPLLLPPIVSATDRLLPGLPLAVHVVLATLLVAAASMLAVGILRWTPLSRPLCGRTWKRPDGLLRVVRARTTRAVRTPEPTTA